jgi:hypothetical protein
MSFSETSSFRLDPSQRSLATGQQAKNISNLEKRFNVRIDLPHEASDVLNITGSDHFEALQAVQELLDTRRTKTDSNSSSPVIDSTSSHQADDLSSSQNHMESTLVDITEIPAEDLVRAIMLFL